MFWSKKDKVNPSGENIITNSIIKARRGINLGNSLDALYEGECCISIKEGFFEIIREAGFDFVRIPIRWSGYAGSDHPYKIDEKFFRRVDFAVNHALSNNLSAIINIHHYAEISENPEAHKKRFIALWSQISEHYRNYPKELYFELLNEPCNNLKARTWNSYLREAIHIIRKTNPDRILLVSPIKGSIKELKSLVIPQEDKNIVINLNYYSPSHFTHQGAPWIRWSNLWLGKIWKGTESEKLVITKDFNEIVRWSKSNNRQVLISEFGVYELADMQSRIRWTGFIAREAEKRHIPWLYWNFCSDFGVYDYYKEEWKEELLNALMPKD